MKIVYRRSVEDEEGEAFSVDFIIFFNFFFGWVWAGFGLG